MVWGEDPISAKHAGRTPHHRQVRIRATVAPVLYHSTTPGRSIGPNDEKAADRTAMTSRRSRRAPARRDR